MNGEKNKILIVYDSIEYFMPFIERKNVDVFRLYKNLNYVNRLLKKIFQLLNLRTIYWYENWLKNCSDYKTIIFFANRDFYPLYYIKRKNPKAKIIFWYWNPAIKMADPDTVPKELCEMWSYDPVDCEKYNLKKNTTFYFKDIKVKETAKEIDLLFLGINKGRQDMLDELNSIMIENNIKTYFHVVPDKNEKRLDSVKPISYKKYLQLISKSKCILDLVPEDNNGMTLRPMEAIFLKRKLITNDAKIMKEPFYNSSNVFVLGVDNFENLYDFINSDYMEVDHSKVLSFDFENWLNRFFVEENN